MSVISCNKTDSEANEDLESASSIDEVYIVQCSASPATDTPLVVLAHTGIPTLNAQYTPGSRLHCKNRKPKYRKESANPWVWDVSVSFSTGSQKNDNSSDDNNPTEDAVQVDGSGVETELPWYIDEVGDPVANSAGDSFDPQPTRIYYDEEVVVTRNESPIDPDKYAQYRGAVNSDDFTIVYPDGTSRTFDAVCVKMGNIKYSYQVRNGNKFYRVTYPLMIRKKTDDSNAPWMRLILDEGYRYLDGGALKDIKIDGKRVTAPVRLDGNGAQLGDGETPQTIPCQDYIEMPFGTLNLSN